MTETLLTLPAEQKTKLDDVTLDALDSFSHLCDILMPDDLELLQEVLDKAELTNEIDIDDIIHAGKSLNRHLVNLSSVYCTIADSWAMKHGRRPDFDTLDQINQAIRKEAEAREETEEDSEA